MINLESILHITCATGSLMVAGTLFAFSNFVMAALGEIPAPAGIKAMQAVNRTVLNLLAAALFFGPALLMCIDLANTLGRGEGFTPSVLLGSFLYFVGVIGVTGMKNVPWNEKLAAGSAESAETQSLWSAYLKRWTRWNHVRCIAAMVAGCLFMIAL